MSILIKIKKGDFFMQSLNERILFLLVMNYEEENFSIYDLLRRQLKILHSIDA